MSNKIRYGMLPKTILIDPVFFLDRVVRKVYLYVCRSGPVHLYRHDFLCLLVQFLFFFYFLLLILE